MGSVRVMNLSSGQWSALGSDDEVQVSLDDGSQVSLDDGSQVSLDDGSQVSLDDGSQVSLDDGSQVSLDDGSQVSLNDGSQVSLNDGSQVPLDDGSQVLLDDRRQVSVDDKRNVSMAKKVMLNGLLGACEASFTFEQLYTASILQHMGVPLRIVFMAGLMSGPTSTVLISLFGAYCDKGRHPLRRKLLAVTLCTCVLLTGMLCVLVAQGYHLAEYRHTAAAVETSDLPIRHNTTEAGAAGPLNGTTPTVPLYAWLAMAGFVCLDCGFDLTNCMARSWTLASCPYQQHASVLNVGVVTSAVGAALPALLATWKVDTLPGLEGLAGSAGIFLQGALIASLVLLGSALTLLTGTALQRAATDLGPDRESPADQSAESCVGDSTETFLHDRGSTAAHYTQVVPDSDTDSSAAGEIKSTPLDKVPLAFDIVPVPDEYDESTPSNSERRRLIASPDSTRATKYRRYDDDSEKTDSDSTAAGLIPGKDVKSYLPRMRRQQGMKRCSDGGETSSESCSWSTKDCRNRLKHACIFLRSLSLCFVRAVFQNITCPKRGLKWKVMAICCGTYFSTGAILLYDFMAVDFVGKAVYGGQPSDDAGTPEAQRYQRGIEMAAWALLVYNGTFLLYSLVQYRVLDFCGYKWEFVISQFFLGGAFVLLAVTSRVEMLFVLSCASGMRRASLCVVPYKLINDIRHEASQSGQGDSRVGRAMALVGVSIPLAYCTLYPWVGAVEEGTGCVATPLYMGAGYAALAALFLASSP